MLWTAPPSALACHRTGRRQLKRRYVLPFFQKLPPCLVGIEACASSHYWSTELQALGHTVRLMPAAYVKSYVKRHKNDAADAEAICEAVTKPNMRFVATKTPIVPALVEPETVSNINDATAKRLRILLVAVLFDIVPSIVGSINAIAFGAVAGTARLKATPESTRPQWRLWPQFALSCPSVGRARRSG
jgi:hypothetical protein